MPELPEVETIVRRLREVLINNSISKVSILREKSFHGDPIIILDKKIIAISRKAKIIIIRFETDLSLIIHLKMTGQLIYQSAAGTRLGGGHPTDDWVHTLPAKHTRAVLELENGTLFFNDMRVFGWLKVVDDLQLAQEFVSYGPDIIDEAITADYLYHALQRRSMPIKLAIMDNSLVAGVGNIYANDALHLAKVNPIRPSKSLSYDEVVRLHMAMKQVILTGIALGGATIHNYRNVDGLAGGYQKVVRVYQREGEKCIDCGTIIKRIKQGGRSTFYCPTCQA